jgi:hypothetical protein
MNHANALIGLGVGAWLGVAALSIAEEPAKPPMHMHKADMDHRSDAEVATEYKSEATQLREKAESHRKLAEHYRGRTPLKGTANFENAAKHCDKLAQLYEEAAKEAEDVATELNKTP